MSVAAGDTQPGTCRRRDGGCPSRGLRAWGAPPRALLTAQGLEVPAGQAGCGTQVPSTDGHCVPGCRRPPRLRFPDAGRGRRPLLKSPFMPGEPDVPHRQGAAAAQSPLSRRRQEGKGGHGPGPIAAWGCSPRHGTRHPHHAPGTPSSLPKAPLNAPLGALGSHPRPQPPCTPIPTPGCPPLPTSRGVPRVLGGPRTHSTTLLRQRLFSLGWWR